MKVYGVLFFIVKFIVLLDFLGLFIVKVLILGMVDFVDFYIMILVIKE